MKGDAGTTELALGQVEIGECCFRDVLGHFASGLILVTGGDGQPHGLTCQSFFSLSLDPPLVAFAPSKASQSWPELMSGGSISINILTTAQYHVAQCFARTGVDKFADVKWYPGVNGAPRIAGSLAWIDCAIEEVHDGGDHYLVTASVLAAERNAGEPLLFYRSGYGSFADAPAVS